MKCWKMDYRALNNIFHFIALFLNSCTDHEKTSSMIRMRTQYSDIGRDVAEDV